MRPISTVWLTPQLAQHVGAARRTATPSILRSAPPYPAASFRELIQHVARLALLNKDWAFFFRGQGRDYGKGSGSSSLYPSIYRGAIVDPQDILNRFALLERAASALQQAVIREKLEGQDDIRKRLVKWSLLQHYQVCGTPLLDLTSSLRIACNFALLEPDPTEPTVYVCGLPYTSGRISVNSEHDTVNVRLLGICPPDALRPLLQEGHVAGTYEITTDYTRKEDLDFSNRLIAKFGLPTSLAFRREVTGFTQEDLFPPDDPLLRIAEEVKWKVHEVREVTPSDLGLFLETWTKLEQILLDAARLIGQDVRSVGKAARLLRDVGLPADTLQRLLSVAETRNKAVHSPQDVDRGMLLEARDEIERLTDCAEGFYRTLSRRFPAQD